MAADICRLCLRPIDKAKSIDLVAETTKFAMLKEFLPEMNLDITENTQVCSNCMQELEVSYNFKQSVVVNEANIQTKLEENKLKKIDLKLMLDDVAKKELKEDDYVCRTCLLICRTPSISLFDTPSNMMPCSFVKKMCQLVFELEFIASDKPVLCDECWETLQTVYNFRKCCLKSDKKLRTYVAKKNLKKLGVEEFKKFVEENPPIDNDEVSSDDELDGYIKEEPIDEEELKFDPEEASCSSASLKFKEETTVKSESDEDMEDEPELLDPKALKSETSELDGEDCKLEIGDVKVDAEGEGAAGPSGVPRKMSHKKGHPLKSKKEISGHILGCKQCTYSTLWKHKLKFHEAQHHRVGPTYKCPKCSYETKIKNYLANHMAVHADAGSLFRCYECPLTFKKKHYLTKHMQLHSGDAQTFNCELCCFKSVYKSNLNSHMSTVHAPPSYQCAECPFLTKRKSQLQRHILRHADASKLKLFHCTQCTFNTIYKFGLDNHMLVHAAPESITLFECAHCSFKTKRKARLKYHMVMHTEPEKQQMLKCPECDFLTTSHTSMWKHKLNHTEKDVIVFPCDICNYKSNKKYNLMLHTKRKHAPPGTLPEFECTVCLYRTKYKSTLNKHLLTHGPRVEKLLFRCEYCPFKTQWKKPYFKHLAGHNESNHNE